MKGAGYFAVFLLGITIGSMFGSHMAQATWTNAAVLHQPIVVNGKRYWVEMVP